MSRVCILAAQWQKIDTRDTSGNFSGLGMEYDDIFAHETSRDRRRVTTKRFVDLWPRTSELLKLACGGEAGNVSTLTNASAR